MVKESNEQYDSIQKQLEKALAECNRLREENTRLKALLGLKDEETKPLSMTVGPALTAQDAAEVGAITRNSSVASKITFFRSLFKGREDVYPVRWEGKDGKTGYSPACANEWKRPFCRKPLIKCAVCKNRELMPVTDQVIFDHLTGKHAIGIYPLLLDETCWFLAADFDKQTWQEDSTAFLETCKEIGILAALERSRSGNGGHV